MKLLYFISNFRIDFLDVFFRGISYMGELTILLPLLCIIYWCINKAAAYLAFFSFFITGAIVQGAKITFRVPRPWVLDPSFAPVDSALKTATGYSFPSGHVQSTSSVFLSLGHGLGIRFIRISSYIVVILVMLSRMYLGVHTPLDVFTSLALSCIVIFVLKHISSHLDIPSSTKAGFLILSIAYSIGISLYAFLLVKWDISTWELAGDSIIFSASLVGFSIGAFIEQHFINFGTHCFSFRGQLIKIALGIGGILGIFFLCSFLPCHEIVIKSLTGFLACIWATCIFPLFIKKIQKKKYHEL